MGSISPMAALPSSGVDEIRGLEIKRGWKRAVLAIAGLAVAAWTLAHLSEPPGLWLPHHESSPSWHAIASPAGAGRPVTLDQVQSGYWAAAHHDMRWTIGPDGGDGLVLREERGSGSRSRHPRPFLAVGHVLYERHPEARVLMAQDSFVFEGKRKVADRVWPSPNLDKVLIATDVERRWRYSSTAVYWIWDVRTQTAEPLEPGSPSRRVQLAHWSPRSDAIAYTADNNLHLRFLSPGTTEAHAVTTDGCPDLMYGVPGWVYEEEVLAHDSGMWWSETGDHIAFLRTNETLVPAYPLQYHVTKGFPDIRPIRYPRAGSSNPTVDVLVYSCHSRAMFVVEMVDGFSPKDRLITDVVWASGRLLIKQTNRQGDILHVVLADIEQRSSQVVRTVNMSQLDGGWLETGQHLRYVPADSLNGRPDEGYLDLVVHGDGVHLAYFAPLDNPVPVMLTTGPWEVDKSPVAVDLDDNRVFFRAARVSPSQRHVYSVLLNGSDFTSFVDENKPAWYDISLSSRTGYALLTYRGPGVPWQKVVTTRRPPAVRHEHVIEDNQALAEKISSHALPLLRYGTIQVDDFELPFLERLPPGFNPNKVYPVLFYQYSGPGSQSVQAIFAVDYQTYVASSLGYVVVTVDGRGTGYNGRRARVCVRGQLGHWETHDQIAAAQHWIAKPYIDSSRVAIWGWSFGGFNTLKTLEQDAGRTFQYGIAIAPVTDWHLYDSIYTERYMFRLEQNRDGYSQSSIRNLTALARSRRFLVMHGLSDDNVHIQNTLALLDQLNLAGIENYDVHLFPDSDHQINFHNANRIVYDKLTSWLEHAFDGKWLSEAQRISSENTTAPRTTCSCSLL